MVTHVLAGPAEVDGPPGEPERGLDAGRGVRWLDALTDLIVLAFAAWTVVFHAGLLVRPPTWALLLAWFAVMAAAAAVWWRWRGRLERTAVAGPQQQEFFGEGRRAVAAVGMGAGIVAGLAAGLHQAGVPWWVVWVAGLASVAATGLALLGPGRRYVLPTPVAGWAMLVVPAVVAAGFAVASVFIVNTDGDDTYFVSRSVWTAAHGRVPDADVMFTQGTVPELAAEPPVSSVEVLVGAVARVFGVPAASMLWYVVLPAVVFLAVWALWRLVREWAPRRALACFVVAAVYLLWTGTGGASFGSFHLLRMWQGKAMLVSALIPLLYVYLSRWTERRSPKALLLVTAAGVAAVGLSSSAVFVVPLVVLAAAAPLVATGRVRDAIAVCAGLVYPVAAGLAVVLLHSHVAVTGKFTDAPVSYSWVLLSGVLGVLAGCALWLGPWLARRGAPTLMTAGIAAVATVLLVTGVLELAADVTNAGQVMWRTMWIVPAPVLVGLFAAVRVPQEARWLAPLPATALIVALVAGGIPVWSAENGSVVESRPSWKAVPKELAAARAVVREAGTGVVLMPQSYMRTVPLFAIGVNAVNPSTHYLRNLTVPHAFIDDRILLSRLVDPGTRRKPETSAVAGALRRVGVVVACARRSDGPALRELAAAEFRGRTRVGALRCLSLK